MVRDLTVEVTCPNCKRRVKIKVKEMVPGRSKSCPYCQAQFQFTGDDGRHVQQVLDDLESSKS